MSRIINGIEYEEYNPSLPKRTEIPTEEEAQRMREEIMKRVNEHAQKHAQRMSLRETM